MVSTADDLKLVMRRWVSGVAVLTCREAEHWQGMTVSSFTSVSVVPPAVTVSLANATRAKAIVESTGFFAINILASVDEELADRFAGRSGDQEDRFRGVEVIAGVEGIPLLLTALAWLTCRVVQVFPFQESTLFIGEVISCETRQQGAPLVYVDRKYRRLK
jgi:flavin reductase (DIM6/NTAB) family NADH-FMN oxidoreductase RutF